LGNTERAARPYFGNAIKVKEFYQFLLHISMIKIMHNETIPKTIAPTPTTDRCLRL
jgi:hypothetical protein